MAHHWKLIVAWLSLLSLCVAPVGCGRNSGTPPTTAAIGGSGGGEPAAAAADDSTPRKPPSDPRHPVVVIETSLGNITVRLDAEHAVLTVDNFLTYVRAGHYDRTIVHQVYKGQGIVAGGYGVDRIEKPARTPIRNEAQNGLKNRRGTIAMVRQPDQIDSATCQFFINVADNPALDYKDRTPTGYGYCVFGEVTDGMEVVDKINAASVQNTPNFDQTPVQQVVIASIRQVQ